MPPDPLESSTFGAYMFECIDISKGICLHILWDIVGLTV